MEEFFQLMGQNVQLREAQIHYGQLGPTMYGGVY